MAGPEGQERERFQSEVTRRGFVGAAGAMGLLAFGPPARVRALLDAVPAAGRRGHFLTAAQLDALRSLTDRLIRSICCWGRSS